MSWFNQGIANLAKSAISQAQKTIDRALDIQEPTEQVPKQIAESDNFFASYGLEKERRKEKMDLKSEKLAESLWGSFSGSFFETVDKSKDEKLTKKAKNEPDQKPESNFVVVDQPSGKTEPGFTRVLLLSSDECETNQTRIEMDLNSEKSASFEALDKSTDSSKTLTQELTDTEENDDENVENLNFQRISPYQDAEDDNSGENSSSNAESFVKCTIDEAIKDHDSGRSHSPHSTTSSDKSDVAKLESEQNSGHTSADEVETTTSSDVEIISMSSPNGDRADKTNSSPVKQLWFGKPPPSKRAPRPDSPASDSSSVKTYSRKSRVEVGAAKDESNADVEKLLKTISDMTEILHVREAKLVELSRENINLQESNNCLKTKMKHAQESHAADTKDVTSLTEQLSQRLATVERNLQQALAEKENLKSEVDKRKEELATRLCAKRVEEMLNEKDAQINELMLEGEKLSKQQLQQSNIIKKLRGKENETVNLIKQQKQQLEDKSAEFDRILKSLSAKEEMERKQIDAIRQLTNAVQKHEKEASIRDSGLTDAREKVKNYQINLDSLTKEVDELRRASHERETIVQEATLSAEMAAKDELKACLERVQREARLTQEGLLMQIEDLRLSLGRSEQNSNRREDSLRLEISDLQDRLQAAETRNQELSQSVSAATRPLLRQIENLQATFSNQSATWEQMENNLMERLNRAQNQLSVAIEKERATCEKYRDVSNRLSMLEAQNDILKQEKNRLEIQLETERTKLNLIQEWKQKELIQKENLKQTYADEINGLKRERKVLAHQLEIEKTIVEAEKRKNASLQDQLKEKERRLSTQMQDAGNRDSPSPTPSLSRFSSVSESYNPWLHDDVLDQSLIMTSSANGGKFNLYEALRCNSVTSVLENLQAQLKMRDGEIVQLQSEIAQLERVRESMALEMIRTSTCNEELDEELRRVRQQQSNFVEMQSKYNALLQMYGEKVEEANELQLDLSDVKEMYKAQISELLNKS